MPIVVTYDADTETIEDNDRNRIVLAFKRLGWEHVGGSAFRYPKLDAGPHPSEDWFNHVIPALMFFRAMVEKKKITLKRFTIEAHSSPGSGKAGADLLSAADITMYEPLHTDTQVRMSDATQAVLSEARLRQWIQAVAEEAPGS